MSAKNEAILRIDNKGRVTLPKSIRQALGVSVGDMLYLKYDAQKRRLHLAPAVSPFDILAENAIKEYEEGQTIGAEELARKHHLKIDG